MLTKFLKLFFPCLVQEEKTKPKRGRESFNKPIPISLPYFFRTNSIALAVSLSTLCPCA